MSGSYSDECVSKAIAKAAEQLGYESLRSNQELVVKHFVGGRDVFVSLPTGSGKSLCYCILPGVFDILRRKNSTSNQSIAIVVSPLIALMKDQVRTSVAVWFSLL